MKWRARPCKTITIIGESMVKYIKIVDEKIPNFTNTQESISKFYLNFILKLLSPYLGLL
jgi:hypothetical protein